MKTVTYTANSPEPVFTGTWTCKELWDLLRQGKINPTEMNFLARVESLTKGPGRGCYASNAYLAEQMGLNPVYVSNMITKLRRLGYIKTYQAEVGDQPLRHIEATYKATENSVKTPTEASVNPPTGSSVAYNTRDLDIKTPLPPSGSAASPPSRVGCGGVCADNHQTKRSTPIKTKSTTRNLPKKQAGALSGPEYEQDLDARAKASTLGCYLPHDEVKRRIREQDLREQEQASTQPQPGPGSVQPEVSMAERLYRASFAKGYVRDAKGLPRSKQAICRLVLEWGLEKVEEAFEFHMKHLGEQFHPHAYCGVTFRKLFPNILRAMDRQGQERQRRSDDDNYCDGDQWGCDEFLPEDQRW